MLLIRGVLLQWLIHDVAPRTLSAVGFADCAAILRASALGVPSVEERARLLAAVREALEQLGVLELNIWTAVAALSCIERLLADETSADALMFAIAGRVAERAGIEMPRLARTAPTTRTRAACRA